MTAIKKFGGLGALLLSSGIVQVGGIVASTLVGVQLARYLGPANYGIYGLIMTVAALLALLAQFGQPVLATREAARAVSCRPQASLRAVIAWFVAVSFLLAGTVVASSALIVAAWSPDWLIGRQNFTGYTAATTFLLSVSAVIAALARGAGKNLAGQVGDALIRPVALSLLLFVAAQQQASLSIERALAAGLVASVIAIGYTSVVLIGLYGADHRPLGSYLPPGWAKASASLASTSLLFGLNSQFPILVAGLFLSAKDVGVLRVALSSALLMSAPLTISHIAVAPVVARLYSSGDEGGVVRMLAQTTVASFFITSLCVAVIAAFGRPLLVAAFGPEYVGAYLPLLIIGSSYIVLSAFGIASTYLNMTGREGLVVSGFLVSVPAGFLLSIPLTWAFGLHGAALGNLISVIAWHVYVLWFKGKAVGARLSVVHAWTVIRARE